MALIYQLLRVLVLGVTAAAVDDIPITWSQSVRNASLPCVVPEWTRVQPRRPPPPLDDDQVRSRPFTWYRVTTREDVITKRISHNGTLEVVRKNGGTTEGVYQCAASHHGGVVLGYPVNLKFSYIGKQFLNSPTDTTAYLNQPLSIPCRISSGPAASISWLRDGRPVIQDQRYYFLESELLIADVRNEDAGTYRCIATNLHLNKSRTSSEGRVRVIDSNHEEPSFLPLGIGENIAVPRGSRVVLPCPVLGWPRPKLRWELTPPGEKKSELESTEEVLVLNNLEYDQEGVYTCSLEDYSGMVKTYNVTLTEPVVITLPPESKDVTRARTVRFNCTAAGRPKPNVTWYKNGEKLTWAGRRNLRSSVDRERLELVISGVTSDDADIGKQFLNSPTDTTAYLNQPLSIPCRISSGPAASISWLRDGRPVIQDQRYYFLESELLIADVRNEDAGTYRCIATNLHLNKSRTSSEGRVRVIDSNHEEPSFLPLGIGENIAVPRGSRVVLPCPVLGWPRPKLRWELTPPGEKKSELESTEEVLVLNNLEYDQEGVYTCSLEDYSGMVKTYNVTLTEPVVITLPPESKDVTRARTVRFNCTAAGRPKPNVTWYKNGEKLTWAGRRNLRSSVDRERLELVISGVTSDDAGVYQCFAWNGHSIASKWARLNVTGAGADAPSAVTCAPASAAAVALRWLPPAEKVMAYTVDTTPIDNHGGAITGQPLTNTEEIIKVREPLTPYLFQVRAYIPASTKKNIASDMSESVLCQGQGVPIKLSKLEDDKILVSWKQFVEQTPGVVEWILQFKRDGTEEQEHNITLAAHVTNYTLTAPESEPIRVRLLGSRTFEWLQQNLTLVPWTSSTLAGQDTDDGEVKVIPQDLEVTEVDEKSFTLLWRCEDETRYTFLVCVRKVDGNDDCHESYETSAKIVGLQPDSKYEVRVQVRVPGRALGGAFTAPFFVTTLSKGPHRFKDLKYKYVNASAIRVSWSDAPARYTVYHSAELKLPVEQWAASEIVGNTVLITGIEPTEETFVMVTGYEPLGHSPILNVPPQVRNLEDKDLKYAYTSSGVCVWWNGTGPRVVRFTQNITQPVESWSAVNVTGTSVELTNLNAGPVFVMVTALGGERRRYPTALTIPERPPDHFYYYLGIGLGCGACALCAVAGGALCLWRRTKAKRTPQRSRRTHTTKARGNEEEGSEMRTARVANGGAGEPLLNGHVHITENPAIKTPNGRLKKARRYEPPPFDAFDVSRHEADTTVETVLDDTTTNSLLDTSRPLQHDLSRVNRSANNSFNKLPDDNMNSELTRSTEFQLDNSKIQPTLQPNG